jgi:hypothetical protein
MPWSAGNARFSQPEICSGDHWSASLCATRHRSSGQAAADKAYRLLNGYIAYLKQRRVGASEPGANIVVDPLVHQPAEPPISELTS